MGADKSRTVEQIEGVITMADGTKSSFYIGKDFGWSQWGADQERLGDSVTVLEALVQGMADAEVPVVSDNDPDEDDEDEDDEGRMNAWPESDTAECAAVGEHRPTARHPFSECPTTGDEGSEEGARSE